MRFFSRDRADLNMADEQNPFFDDEEETPENKPEETLATNNSIGDTTEISLDGDEDEESAKPDEKVGLEENQDEQKPELSHDSGAAASVDVTNLSEPGEFSSSPVEVPSPKVEVCI